MLSSNNLKNISKALYDGFINLVYTNPNIIYTQAMFFRDKYYLKYDFNYIDYILFADNWYYADNKYRPTQLKLIIEGITGFKEKYPKCKIIRMKSDSRDSICYFDLLSADIMFHRNYLIDYKDYTVFDRSDTKIYDAVYTANFYSYKRHILLDNCIEKTFAFIYYLRDKKNKIKYISDEDLVYGKHAENKYKYSKNIDLLNIDENNHYKFLTKNEMSKIYANCKIGLMLSDIEGPCLTVAEYLFSGLPVAYTDSLGGIHTYLKDNEHSILISDINTENEIYKMLDSVKHLSFNKRLLIRKCNIALTTDNLKIIKKEILPSALSNNKIDYEELLRNMIYAQKTYKV